MTKATGRRAGGACRVHGTAAWMLALATILGFCVAGSAWGAGDVALVNGDFEGPEAGAGGVPVGWRPNPAGVPGKTCVDVDFLRARSGARALRMSDNRTDLSVGVGSRLYPAIPGETYRASAWEFNGQGDGWLYLEFYASPSERISEKHNGCGTTGEWTQIVVEDICPPEAGYVGITLYSAVHNVGVSAWDDVLLEGPAGEGEPLNLDQPQEETVDYTYLRTVGDAKQLLFDDKLFESHKGFWWRVCQPRKTGERNVLSDQPWEDFTINAWHSVMEDEGKYRMWYEAYDKSYTSDLQARYCYAESTDGIHWEKPNLGIETFNGSKENNILFNQLGGAGVHGGTVFKDPQGTAEERYKFVYLAPEGDNSYAIRAATSPDGLHWKQHEGGAILDVSSDTQTVAFWDTRLLKYVIYCRLWTPNRTVGRSESADFYDFPMAQEVLACDEYDPPDCDLYNSAAMKYPLAENAYVIFTSVYHHTADNLDVHLAVSRDGIHWSRPSRDPFIANGEPGSMDDAMVYCGTGVLPQGDELWMYYWGSRCRHNQHTPQAVTSHGVYSRAVLRLDGYVALDAAQYEAEFSTYPLTFTGKQLEINADVRPAGYVKLELQDAEGTPIPGFTLGDCAPLAGDNVRHVVQWQGKADLGTLAGTPVRVRCVARDASLYAFQFAR